LNSLFFTGIKKGSESFPAFYSAIFIIENIIKDEKATLAKTPTALRFCQETETIKMEIG
jgi:hypothetical protein